MFDGPCSTPEVSFAIRELNADTGVVITASHNPAHDNGFKAYFNDGAQLVAPHDKGVIDCVNALQNDHYDPLPAQHQGELTVLGKDMDIRFMNRLKGIILRRSLVRAQLKWCTPTGMVPVDAALFPCCASWDVR